MALKSVPPKPLAKPLPGKFTGQANKAPVPSAKPLTASKVLPNKPKASLNGAPKHQLPAVKTKSTAIAERGEPTALMLKMMQENAGEGVSPLAEDNLVPFINLLQALSPACDTNNPAHMEGATAGAFLFRATNELVDGEEGFEFQPCRFDKDWVEWIPRKKGGGIVARHKERPEDAEKEEDDENPQRIKWVMPNGNELIETRYFVGRVNSAAYIMALTSTGHKFAKELTTLMNSHPLPGGGVEPAYSRSYLIKSKYAQKAGNSWYTWNIDKDMGYVSEEDYIAGKNLHDAFERGEKRADESQFEMSGGGSGRVEATEDNEQEEM